MKNISPVANKVSNVNNVPVNSVLNNVLAKTKVTTSPMASPKLNTSPFSYKPIVSSYAKTHGGFYQHGGIKSTISPYHVADKPVLQEEISHVSHLPKSISERFGFSSFRELFVGPGDSKNQSLVDSVVNTNNSDSTLSSAISHGKSNTLVVASPIFPSPYSPVGVKEEFYFRSTLIGAIAICKKCEMPLEINVITAVYFAGNSGQNIQLIQAVAKEAGLLRPMNMLPYFPANVAEVLPNPLFNKLHKLAATNFGLASEAMSCIKLNESFQVPFIIHDPDPVSKKGKKGEQVLLEDNTIVDGALVHNNTGQRCPDFVRTLSSAEGNLIKDTYDLKASISPLKELNHVRLVSSNVGEILLEAREQLATRIRLWESENPSTDVGIVDRIFTRLTTIKQQFEVSLDVHTFRRDYNSIRSEFADFFIRHRIPMNLIIDISIEDFPIDISDLSFFHQAFSELYNSPNSPVLKIYEEYLASHNNEVKDSTDYFKYLAKRLAEYSDF